MIKLKDVSCVYTARKDGCRCGCGGSYTYNSMYKNQAAQQTGRPIDNTEISDLRVQRIIDILNKNVDKLEVGDGYLNFEKPSGRVYTAYLIDQK